MLLEKWKNIHTRQKVFKQSNMLLRVYRLKHFWISLSNILYVLYFPDTASPLTYEVITVLVYARVCVYLYVCKCLCVYLSLYGVSRCVCACVWMCVRVVKQYICVCAQALCGNVPVCVCICASLCASLCSLSHLRSAQACCANLNSLWEAHLACPLP